MNDITPRAALLKGTPDMADSSALRRPLLTREEALQGCAEVLAHAVDELGRMTPEAVAEQAYVRGGPSREVIAERFRVLREKYRVNPAPRPN